jgi:hypothetical protein
MGLNRFCANDDPWAMPRQALGPQAALRGSKYRMVDAHLHVVDFVQNTPGGEAIIDALDRANVEKAVIFGLPVTKLWTEFDLEPPEYYLANDAPCYYYGYTDVIVAELVRNLSPSQQDRLYPLICGFNPVDRLGIRHIERLYGQYPEVWSGIGELLLRHDDLTAFTYGDNARANHQALCPVYEFAADHGLPVLIHSNVTSVTRSDRPLYLHELKQPLAAFPQTQFIYAHCGMSRRLNAPFYLLMIEELFQRYPNLAVDYSWLIYDVAICPYGKPNLEWVELTERWSERICLGSDLVCSFERLGPELARYDVFLDRLSPAARANVCWHTAQRLYGSNKGKVRRRPATASAVHPAPAL